jgi:Family of unknown function (DUF6152)
MRSGKPFSLLGALVVLALPALVHGHHSLSGQFDVGRSFEISGVVSRVDWVNPHTYLYVDVKQTDGTLLTYKLESLPVAMMRKAGVSKQDLQAGGQAVKVKAHPARNGSPTLGYMLYLHLPDGRDIQFGRVPGAEQP